MYEKKIKLLYGIRVDYKTQNWGCGLTYPNSYKNSYIQVYLISYH